MELKYDVVTTAPLAYCTCGRSAVPVFFLGKMIGYSHCTHGVETYVSDLDALAESVETRAYVAQRNAYLDVWSWGRHDEGEDRLIARLHWRNAKRQRGDVLRTRHFAARRGEKVISEIIDI